MQGFLCFKRQADLILYDEQCVVLLRGPQLGTLTAPHHASCPVRCRGSPKRTDSAAASCPGVEMPLKLLPFVQSLLTSLTSALPKPGTADSARGVVRAGRRMPVRGSCPDAGVMSISVPGSSCLFSGGGGAPDFDICSLFELVMTFTPEKPREAP